MRLDVLISSIFLTTPALAHIQLDEPAPRGAAQKAGPCGAPGGVRGDNVAVFTPGQTITVTWRETINHPSHYRISFDEDGDDDFRDPEDFMDFSGNPTVLVDAIEDLPAAGQEQEVTLPNVTCERCTLQVVQVMYDKPPYGDGNDLYYQCADLALRGAVVAVDAAPLPPDVSSPEVRDAALAEAGSDDQGPVGDDVQTGDGRSATPDGASGDAFNGADLRLSDTSLGSSDGCTLGFRGLPSMMWPLVSLLGLAALRRRRA